MKLNLVVSNEDQSQLVSSVLQNLRDSPFNDVTLVCSDGQLKVNYLTLALLLPEPYRSLQLDEGALLLLPDYKVQEFRLMVDPEEQEQEKEQDNWITLQPELEQYSKTNIENDSSCII